VKGEYRFTVTIGGPDSGKGTALDALAASDIPRN
jgi:hypothetical protein